MQRKKMLIAVLAIALLVGVVSAATIVYFGQVKMTTTVNQAVLVDGHSYPYVIEESATVAGGESFCRYHWLQSQTSVPVAVQFETAYDPPVVSEITTSYWKLTGYKETIMVTNATVTVEDLGNSVKWTINMTEPTAPYQSPFKNGHAAVALVIGVGNSIIYQVHSNDGTCSAYPWGTWLLSYHDSTGGGYFGWHSSEAVWNKPVAEYGIDATGERDLASNPTLLYTITIPKGLLSCGEFKWALVLIGDDTFAKIQPAFEWSDTGTTNFHTATVGTPITASFVLQPKEKLDFCIGYKFDLLIEKGTYTIYSTVKPVP